MLHIKRKSVLLGLLILEAFCSYGQSPFVVKYILPIESMQIKSDQMNAQVLVENLCTYHASMKYADCFDLSALNEAGIKAIVNDIKDKAKISNIQFIEEWWFDEKGSFHKSLIALCPLLTVDEQGDLQHLFYILPDGKNISKLN